MAFIYVGLTSNFVISFFPIERCNIIIRNNSDNDMN